MAVFCGLKKNKKMLGGFLAIFTNKEKKMNKDCKCGGNCQCGKHPCEDNKDQCLCYIRGRQSPRITCNGMGEEIQFSIDNKIEN